MTAGFSLHDEIWMAQDFAGCRPMFWSPGIYKVRASALAKVGKDAQSRQEVTIESNTLLLSVAADKREQGPMMFWTWSASAGALLGLEDDPLPRLVRRAPESSYAEYARFALSADTDRPPEERISLLKDLIASDPPAQLADLALLRLARLLDEQKQYAACKDYASRVLRLDTAPPWRKLEAEQLVRGAETMLEIGK